MIRSHLRVLTSIGVFLVIGACASSEEPGERPTPPPLVPDDCVATCSADGRSVVDCHGAVVTECAAASSCVAGVCVAGCEAAAEQQSTVGCEYYAAKPSANTFTLDAPYFEANCYAVLVANTWSSPVELEVEYDGQPISSSYFRIPRGRGNDIRYELLPEGKLPQGELAILFLAMHPKLPEPMPGEPVRQVQCPAGVGAAIVGETSVRGSGLGKMFHIRSSAPVVAYDIYPYGGAESFIPSASLLLPTSAWGTENLAMDGYSVTDERVATWGFLPYFQILAREDETHVQIKPTGMLSSAAGHPPIKRGETGEFVLHRGQFLQFTQAQNNSGTGVESDKPVSVVGGATCMYIPNQIGPCDTLHQNLPPIRLFGDTYVATRHRDRGEPEITPWRILAAANDTKLTYDPPMPEAPATLQRGEWKEFWAPGPFVVRSQDNGHPIYVAAYMTSNGNVSTPEGDPEMVNVVPVGQYLSSYVFLTDPTYRNTNLVFVRLAVEGKYEDVQLDCLGTVEGWAKVGSTNYEIAYVDLVKGAIPQGACDNGVHRASSKNPFTVTVWGWDQDASYGFPAGMGTKTLNDVPAIR
jgi:IgGFc binding protein